MYDVDNEYNDSYYGSRMSFKESVYPILASVIERVYKPKNIVDVGCGNGVLMDGFIAECLGIEASSSGIRLAAERGHNVILHDLRRPLQLGVKFDLAVSIEVAEHLEQRYAGVFVSNLTRMSDQIVLTASPKVEQYHYNPQSKDYWIRLFEMKGFVVDEKTELLVSLLRQKIPAERDYLYNNMICFSKV